MPTFNENLAELPATEHIQTIELYGDNSQPDCIIENIPGQQGSVSVYYHLAILFGGISPKAAEKGLEIFAEKTLEAQQQPGRHPNIDRLFKIIEQKLYYSVKTIRKK